VDARPEIAAFAAELRARANAQFETPQHKRLFSVPLTLERAQTRALQTSLWNLNRRTCWAFAQGLAPFDVKQLIWQHEEDELAGNKARGVEDHYGLQVRQGSLLQLTPDDFRTVRMSPGTRACTYAWIHLVKDSHWLKAVSACNALEVSNSTEWVEGGGGSYRWGKRLEEQLGIPFHKQVNAKEHAEVDADHSHMVMQIARRHATTPDALGVMLDGCIESWELESVWKGQLAEMMEALPGPPVTTSR
jgi:hypothetical protein